MYVIKRNGEQAVFDKNKIVSAISKANNEILDDKLSDNEIVSIADTIENKASNIPRALGIE